MRLHRNVLFVLAAGIPALAVSTFMFILFFGADLDNLLQVRLPQELRVLQSLPVGAHGETLAAVIARDYPNASWRAYHPSEELYITVVECTTNPGQPRSTLLAWEVSRNYSPHPAVPVYPIFVTALTAESAQVTPSFRVPGLLMSNYQTTPYPILGSRAYYSWASGSWPHGVPPTLPPHVNP